MNALVWIALVVNLVSITVNVGATIYAQREWRKAHEQWKTARAAWLDARAMMPRGHG